MTGPLLTALLAAAGGGRVAAADTPYNLLLLTIDTLRADHLGVNGGAAAATPNLDRLARGGVNFARARSPVPLTLPAHASILTGDYPPTHGLRDNGRSRLAPERLTLAEVLAARGWETAAFVGSFVLDRRFGLAQGFALYDDRIADDPDLLESLEAERSADAVLAAFTGWLGRRDLEVPFFAWVHLFDPHAPWEPPEPWRSRYRGDPYAGEVAYADHAVGRLVARLDSAGLLGRTLVAVAGDHGEGLGAHGETTHSLLIYNSTLHVPLILRGPGLLPTGVEVGELARLIDLAPTLLDYLGVDAALGAGRSLRPLIARAAGAAAGTAPSPPAPRSSYSESLYGRLNLGWSELHGIEEGGFRLIQGARPELYDLAADPGETVNLVGERPDVYARLRARLADVVDAPGAATAAEGPAGIDAATAARLRSLGYLAAPRPPAAREPADPDRKMELWNRLQLAMAAFARGDYERSGEILEGVLEGHRDIPLLYEYLGASLMRLERLEQAERVYRQALERGIESAAMRVDLGLILARRGEPSAAERELRAALAIDQESVTARHRLGDLYRSGRRYDQAEEQYRLALAVNPSYLFAWNGLGMALAATGRNQEALSAFRRAVEADPDAAPGRFNLAVQLERMGLVAEARSEYRRFLELSAGQQERAAERGRAVEALRRLQAGSD